MTQPTKLGKYIIQSELGKGAMGIVYRAEDPRLGRPVALKVMSANVAGNPDLLKRFYREAQAAGQLRHPNIVTIYDIDEVDGIPFIAMEFLEGEDLDKIISAEKELSVTKKLDVIIQACKGLHHAHQHGMVHRDVKPGNIVVLNDGMVKIVDFGIAHLGASSMTQTGMVLGTVMYMSPEQISGLPVDARADIFSIGIILYETLTYKTPFSGRDVPSILYKIINEPPEPLTERLSNCPPILEKIVNRALEKDRTRRYQTAEDLAFDLQRVADSLKRQMVDVYLKQGERFKEEQNFTLAKESLQKVLEIDSNHDLARTLLDQVKEQIYSRQRGQKIVQLLRQAKEALQSEDYDEALPTLDEILQLDPEHAEARQYKQQAVESRERKQKIARHMERAEKFVSDVDFQAAKAELESVLSVDREHAAAQKMMEWVLKELAEQQRSRQVRQCTESARAQMAEKNFAKALEWLGKAREIDPINIEVDSLTRLVKSSQEKDSRRQLLDQRLGGIEEALNLEQFDQALALADQTLQEFADDSRALKLRTQAARLAEAHKKRLYIEEQLHTARDLLQKNEYSAALAVLERGLQAFPEDARLASFLKTVQGAQEDANQNSLRSEATRQAHELIRAKNYDGAIELLEETLARAGQSPELIEFLQFARDQQADQQKQEQIRQVLTRAQTFLREENFEEAIYLLERSQKEFQATEVGALLASAREQLQKFERNREEIIGRARKLLEGGDASKAVASLDAAPKAYFKNEQFQRIYAQCRESLERATAIRSALDQVERCMAREDLRQAEGLLRQALQAYPGDVKLLAGQKRLNEEQLRVRRALWKKLLDDVRVDMGRMQYKEAVGLLNSIDWKSAEVPDLAEQAKSLLEEANRRQDEIAKKQTVIRAQPFPPPVPDAAGVLSAQERLRVAMQAGGRAREAPTAKSGAPAAGGGTVPPPTTPPAARQVIGGIPASQSPGAGVARPPAAPRAPTIVAPEVARAKRPPIALWAGVGVLVLALAGFAAWRFLRGNVGYVQLTSTPWADIRSVEDSAGKRLNVTGETPLVVALPPGKYVIELQSQKRVGKVNVEVNSGEVDTVNYAFPEVKVDAMVDGLVSKY